MSIRQHFEEASTILQVFLANEDNFRALEQAGELMSASIRNGGKIFSCGNGGSLCDAMHFAEELTGRYRNDRPSLPAIAISDPGYMSCVGNDYGYEYVFSRFIEGMGRPGDVLLAISTSGNSANVVRAMETAREKGMKVVGLTGKNGGKMAGMCDVEIRAPFSNFADRAQEIHIKCIHSLIDYIEKHV